MFWKRKVQVPADIIAQSLFQECVEVPIPGTRELFPADADTPGFPSINQQIRLYQFASVLLALLEAERKNPAFTSVVRSFERYFFPSAPTEGAAELVELRSAMDELTTLLQPGPQRQQLSWARNWLLRIGVHETNPATLAMFALRWPSHYIAAAKSLREVNPIP